MELRTLGAVTDLRAERAVCCFWFVTSPDIPGTVATWGPGDRRDGRQARRSWCRPGPRLGCRAREASRWPSVLVEDSTADPPCPYEQSEECRRGVQARGGREARDRR